MRNKIIIILRIGDNREVVLYLLNRKKLKIEG